MLCCTLTQPAKSALCICLRQHSWTINYIHSGTGLTFKQGVFTDCLLWKFVVCWGKLRQGIHNRVRKSKRWLLLLFFSSGALQIENSEESDQGKYECVATNSAGTRYSAPANLYVRGKRHAPGAAPIKTTSSTMIHTFILTMLQFCFDFHICWTLFDISKPR